MPSGTQPNRFKMPEIADLMDVNLEDLSPEQRQQLQDVVDQFQQKCLLSFKKNRSSAPYLKNEMPRVLLPGESDATSQQEKEECAQVFQESADYMLSKHNKAFLGSLQQMMVAVFGPGMEQAFGKAPMQGGTVELGESSSQPPLRSQPQQTPPQSSGSQAFQPPPQGTGGGSQFSPHYKLEGVSQFCRHHRAAQVSLCNSRTRTSLRTETWRSARLGPHLIPAGGLLRRPTGCRGICTAAVIMKWATTERLTPSRTQDTRQLQAHKKMTPWRARWPN
jgi:hypothetical protein